MFCSIHGTDLFHPSSFVQCNAGNQTSRTKSHQPSFKLACWWKKIWVSWKWMTNVRVPFPLLWGASRRDVYGFVWFWYAFWENGLLVCWSLKVLSCLEKIGVPYFPFQRRWRQNNLRVYFSVFSLRIIIWLYPIHPSMKWVSMKQSDEILSGLLKFTQKTTKIHFPTLCQHTLSWTKEIEFSWSRSEWSSKRMRLIGVGVEWSRPKRARSWSEWSNDLACRSRSGVE